MIYLAGKHELYGDDVELSIGVTPALMVDAALPKEGCILVGVHGYFSASHPLSPFSSPPPPLTHTHYKHTDPYTPFTFPLS